jgi:hypothetical protein
MKRRRIEQEQPFKTNGFFIATRMQLRSDLAKPADMQSADQHPKRRDALGVLDAQTALQYLPGRA